MSHNIHFIMYVKMQMNESIKYKSKGLDYNTLLTIEVLQ